MGQGFVLELDAVWEKFNFVVKGEAIGILCGPSSAGEYVMLLTQMFHIMFF
jgi:hypothetical protein